MVDLCSKYSLAFNIIFILFFLNIIWGGYNETQYRDCGICQLYNKDNKPKDIEDNYNIIECIIW